MPSHKPLKGISHNFSHSFISLMNYVGNDYFLGHLLKQAKATGLNRLEIDILENRAQPDELINETICNSIRHWNDWFPTLVANSGSKMDFVNAASMVIEFDLQKSRPFSGDQRILENPFKCEITITDDRGKQYSHIHEGWWFPES